MAEAVPDLVLTRCSNCWLTAKFTESGILRPVNEDDNRGEWTPVSLGNNKWAFQADNGAYLFRCHHCVKRTYTGMAFVRHYNPATTPETQWEVTQV